MRRPATAATLGALLAAGCVPDGGRPDFEAVALIAVTAAEDVRPAGGPALEVLVAGTRAPRATVRAAAVRGLGRIERPALLPHVLPLLDDPEPRVRAEAANAVAQAVHRTSGTEALEPLLARLDEEDDPGVRGVLARSLGRLALGPSEREVVGRVLLRLSRAESGEDAPRPQLLGVALGSESYARRGAAAPGAGTPVGDALAQRLSELSRHGLGERVQSEAMVWIRALSLTALAHAGRLSVFEVEAGLRDPGEAPRRVAASRIGAVPAGARSELVRRALRDPSHQVRWEAVRVVAAGARDELACTRLLAAAQRDASTAVRLAALDALDLPCPDPRAQAGFLEAVASAPDASGPMDWHQGARALTSLAALDPDRARPLLAGYVGHASPFARARAARSAVLLGALGEVERLLSDPSPNVREAAARALAELRGREADARLTAALAEADDPQLVITLARLLGSASPDSDRFDVGLAALARLSAPREMTLRDARVALLDLVERAGEPSRVPDVEPYLRDFDPAVAQRAAELLLAWTGSRYVAAPRRHARLPLPTAGDLREMERTTVVLHMARGGSIEIRLLPHAAATNAFRLLRLARDGALDGLTFHRVVPNFVIQGASPGANEYAGHGSHTRDEVGLAVQWRGTVGLSTRGRDTGDGQIYVNLVDNVRLDHDYTVLGVVTEGMDVVDAVLEGDPIERAEVRAR